MFEVGDILLKIDVRRRTFGRFDTRNHVMIIIGFTNTSYPIVAHMKFTDHDSKTGQLVIEKCPRSKDLVLLSLRLNIRTQLYISDIANRLLKKNFLTIDVEFLEKNYNDSSAFFPYSAIEAPKKLEQMKQVPDRPNPLNHLNGPTSIACHNFVLSLVKLACEKSKEPCPKGLQIPSHLAWSSLIQSHWDRHSSEPSKHLDISPTAWNYSAFFQDDQNASMPSESKTKKNKFFSCQLL